MLKHEARRLLAQTAVAPSRTSYCCAVLCCAVLCWPCCALSSTVLRCALLNLLYAALRCAALRCVVLCCAVLYWPCCAVLCCAALCSTGPAVLCMCCAVLCCAVLCCAMLCCAPLCWRCCALRCCCVLTLNMPVLRLTFHKETRSFVMTSNNKGSSGTYWSHNLHESHLVACCLWLCALTTPMRQPMLCLVPWLSAPDHAMLCYAGVHLVMR